MSENDAEILRILLVDDDEDDCYLIRDFLSESIDKKYELVWEKTFEEGLKRFSDRSFSLFLLDYRLGERTGLDLLQAAVKIAPTVPIILMTGFNDMDVDWRAIREGADDYLTKNGLSSDVLLRAIRYALARAENKAARKALEAQVLRQDRLASLGLLASSLAHEIGTPLGIIRGRAELLALKAKDDSSTLRNLEVIVSQIDRVAKLIRSLLNLARGATAGERMIVHVQDAVNDVVDLISAECKNESITLSIIADPMARVEITSEGETLQQVLLNLVVNSIHALKEVKKNNALHIKDNSPLKISILAHQLENKVVIEVTDNGIGISPENLKDIFKPFFTTKDVGEGTGLGLATSYRIVQSWCGKMEVESTQNLGATFRITLPSSEC